MLDEIIPRLKDLAASHERSYLIYQWSDLGCEETIRELARTVRASL